MIYLLFIFFIIVDLDVLKQVPGLNYFDEVITLVAILLIATKFQLFIKRRTIEKKILLYTLGVFLIGAFSTYRFHYQMAFSGIWRDALALLKYPLCYIAFYKRTINIDKDHLLKKLEPSSRLIILIIFAFEIANIYFIFPQMTDGFRYGFPLYKFIYAHSTYLIAAIILLISVLISKGFKRNLFFIFLGALEILLTFRSKPVVIIIFLAICVFFRKGRNGRKLSTPIIICCLIFFSFMTIYFTRSQVNAYVGYADTSARGAYYIKGFEIATNHFPLGSGFCTFASSLAHKYYSPLYYKYGISTIWGLTEEDGSYASDAYWPYIYAQYGILGLILYLLMICYIFKSINSRFNFLSDKWVAAMSLLLYTIFASFAESFLTNDSAAIYAVSMALFIGNDEKKDKK